MQEIDQNFAPAQRHYVLARAIEGLLKGLETIGLGTNRDGLQRAQCIALLCAAYLQGKARHIEAEMHGLLKKIQRFPSGQEVQCFLRFSSMVSSSVITPIEKSAPSVDRVILQISDGCGMCKHDGICYEVRCCPRGKRWVCSEEECRSYPCQFCGRQFDEYTSLLSSSESGLRYSFR